MTAQRPRQGFPASLHQSGGLFSEGILFFWFHYIQNPSTLQDKPPRKFDFTTRLKRLLTFPAKQHKIPRTDFDFRRQIRCFTTWIMPPLRRCGRRRHKRPGRNAALAVRLEVCHLIPLLFQRLAGLQHGGMFHGSSHNMLALPAVQFQTQGP